MKTAEIKDTIKEQLKEEAKFFQNYDVPTQHQNQPIATKEKNLDPFKKVNWKNIFDSNENGEYYTKKDDGGNLLWAYFMKKSKGKRGIKDFADDVVGTIQMGDLQIIRFAYQTEYLDGTVVKCPKAYPSYTGSYSQMSVIQDYVEELHNVYPVGRNGLHKYNNQDHSMMTAVLSVRNIILGEKNNIWKVNVEEDYHEEISSGRSAPTQKS